LLQHAGSVRTSAIDPRRPVRTLAALLRSPAWALGAVVGVTGWALHIGAMREAPLSLVQAFVAGGLALAVPMAAVGLGQRLAPGERQALALMVVALALLSLGLPRDAARAHFEGAALGAWLAGLGVLAGLVAARAPAARRPAALGLAGGLLYGAADLALKAVTGASSAVSAAPWIAAAAVATMGAFFAFQRGLQTGRALPVIALMTAATNIGSIAGAFVVLGDRLGRTPQLAALHALAFALVLVAAWGLAPAQARLVAPGAT
ncbi:MAG TPA: hypothetical protein VH418_13895, partial [Solirubrobacteraceae bacterium]